MPSSFQTLEGDAASLQDSLGKGPCTLDTVAITLKCALRCQQVTTSLSHKLDRRVRFFEDQFDPRGFFLNVLTALTTPTSHDPDDEIRELSSKYDFVFSKRVTDIVLNHLKNSVVTHDAMNSALSGYVRSLELTQQASDFREQLQLSQTNFVDRDTLTEAVTRFGHEVTDLTNRTDTLTADTESLNRTVGKIQSDILGIRNATASEISLLDRVNAQAVNISKINDRQLHDEHQFAVLLKDLGSRLKDHITQDINKLRSELLTNHIQDLRTHLESITMADLRPEIEALKARIDSLLPETTGWEDLDTATAFANSKILSMLRDIAELKVLSRQCHCKDEIDALRKTFENKIGKILIRTYKDEVTALNQQINIIGEERKTLIFLALIFIFKYPY